MDITELTLIILRSLVSVTATIVGTLLVAQSLNVKDKLRFVLGVFMVWMQLMK